ncbi:HAD-like protein [Xylariaceae sp. FL0662B]|nr:HAD-like protein [Xylariaceae sp. FL0662B]
MYSQSRVHAFALRDILLEPRIVTRVFHGLITGLGSVNHLANNTMSQAHASPKTQLGAQRRIKAVFFDFMGTCLNWHTGVVDALPATMAESIRSKMALDWRQEFFGELHARSQQGLPPEDIDVTHRRTLLRILSREPYQEYSDHFVGPHGSTGIPSDSVMAGMPALEIAVQSWHSMSAWPDVLSALMALKKELGLELFVLANGTTRLQLDLVRSSGLAGTFSMLFSSELLGVYKPSPEAYRKALGLVRVLPEDAVMVAAHAYDLRAARRLGMKTVYVHRWTDDADENMETIRKENDSFLDDNGMQGLLPAIRALD